MLVQVLSGRIFSVRTFFIRTGFLAPILCQSLAVDLKQKGVKVEIELFVSMSCRRRRRQRHNVAVDSETLKNFYPGKKGTVSLPCMVGLVDCG